MTPFSFDHVFRARDAAAVLDAYFDPDHQREQDEALAIAERVVLERVDDADGIRRVCRAVPHRQLPSILRPFVDGGVLAYRETAIWRRRERSIDLEIRPTLRGGRTVIRGTYALDAVAGGIRRRYAGEVRVELALVGGRVERGIVAELAASMPVAAKVTQRWLDRGLGAVSAFA